MDDQQKVEALKNELPPFDINDLKYANLKYALGKFSRYMRYRQMM